MKFITHWPAVILANYRTGSSPLCLKLGKEYGVPSFVEPWNTSERQVSFLEVFNSSTNYIVKFMPDQIDFFKPYSQLLESSSFKIKLQRKNKIEQIASYYIATLRDKWWTTNNDQDNSYFIPIKLELLQECARKILYVDNLLNNYNEADLTLWYEDLDYFDDIDRKQSAKPNNMNRLLDVIEQYVNR